MKHELKTLPSQWPIILAGVLLIGIAAFFFLNNQTPIVNQSNDPYPGYNVGDVYLPGKYVELLPAREAKLETGSTFALSAEIVQYEIGGKTVYGYAYNQQIPGPLIKVKKGDRITVQFTNNIDQPTTVHWHGLRLENKNDGVPGVTQEEVLPGESFTYTLDFPDEGLFWYHPHVREDMQQELGLYGAILVSSAEGEPVYTENVLVIDDIRMENNQIAPFPEKETNFAVMGRFGNTFLVNGKTDYSLSLNANTINRLYLLNTSNVRPYRLTISGAKIKSVGADVGKFGQPFLTNEIILAPSERAIIDVVFQNPGEYMLTNDTPVAKTILAKFQIKENSGENQTLNLEANLEAQADIEQYREYFDDPVAQTYELTIRWPVMDTMMKNMQHGGMEMKQGMGHTEQSTIEWEDEMEGVNAITTNEEVTWIIRDEKTKKENMDFNWNVKKGDIKKIRIKNLSESSHPMQHPIHLHGNRFLVLTQNGKTNQHLVWKDTVLIPQGEEVELLVEFTNPGEWMLHCHIAEHLSSEMMTSVMVE